MLLAIALAGSGEVSERNAKALLNDFIGDKLVLPYVPNYITQEQDGLRTAIDCLPLEPTRVRKSMLIERLFTAGADEHALIILGPEGLESLIEEAQGDNVPVLDLTKALMQHTGSPVVALDGSESNADWLADPSEGEPLGNESDLVRIDPSAVNILPGLNDRQRKEVEEIVTAAIDELERRYLNGIPVDSISAPKPEILEPVVTVITEDAKAPNYYRSKTGKLRPIGRSKARPGETAVFLTDEEINALPA